PIYRGRGICSTHTGLRKGTRVPYMAHLKVGQKWSTTKYPTYPLRNTAINPSPKQVRNRARKSVESPNTNHINAPLVGIDHEPVQFGPRILRTTHTFVNVNTRHVPSTRSGELFQFARLQGYILSVICGADPCVDCDTFYSLCSHRSTPFEFWLGTQDRC